MFKGPTEFVDMTVDDRLFPVIHVIDRALLFVVGPGITLFPPIPIPTPTYLDRIVVVI